MRYKIPLSIFLIFFLGIINVYAQKYATVAGKITDENGNPIELVNVAVVGYSAGTTTDIAGKYEMRAPAGKEIFIDFSFIGFESRQFKLTLLENEHRKINVTLKITTTELPGFEVRDEQIRNTNYIRLDPKEANFIPTISGGVEDLLVTLPGVSSSNELSSQYSVRGGNFDENLVYVNGVEIYRPFLIRAGQQEGLSFIYPQLVSTIVFSAGGFDAKYGDRMSSVLDIQYRRPTSFGGSAMISFLGVQFHLEGISKNKRFTYLGGIRYKTNQYLLNAMDTKGSYKPNFTDAQAVFTYRISEKLELSFLGHYSNNSYRVVPETRETDFGTFSEAFRLKVYFDGEERDLFKTYTGALTLDYQPRENLDLKFIVSSFRTQESETYDIMGQYWIGLLENALGDEQFGNVVAVQGVGTHLDHARNYLDAIVFNVEHKGAMNRPASFIQWGIKYQHEIMDDKFNEWELIDSAGYSIPNPATNIGGFTSPKQPLDLYYSVSARNKMNTNRYAAFVQDSWNFEAGTSNISLTAGLRAAYWDFNNEFVLSPRATVALNPHWKKDIVFRFSTGYYYQPPFYKEARDLQGNINPDIRAQKSIHFVLGSDLSFMAWSRPFTFTTEVYYKYLDNLIPYIVDNVRIRYYGENISHGYATGIDFRINGEFIKGIESWASLSIMKTMEDIEGDYYYDYFNESGEQIIPGITIDNTPFDSVRVEPGYIPRPTDQRVNFSIFFQDYIPKNPTWKMHLKMIFGTGLPFGPPDSPKYKHTLRYPPYRRVDIGFSKQLIGGYSEFKDKNPLRYIKNAWITLEVFNLFQIYNTVSYTWVTDVNGRQYAVPNYLTTRRVNLKLIIDF